MRRRTPARRGSRASRQPRRARPRPPGVGARPDHERRRLRLLEQGGEPVDGVPVRGAAPQRPGRGRHLVPLRHGSQPVVHRDDHERRAACGLRLVPGASQGAGHVLGARRLVDPDRIVAGEPLEAPREKRLLGQMAAVLLPHEHHERRPVRARRGQGGNRIAESGGGVHEDEGGLAPGDRPPGRHAHHGPLVQAEDEAHVVGQPAQEGHLRRPRVGEDGGQAVLAHDVEGQVAHGRAALGARLAPGLAVLR